MTPALSDAEMQKVRERIAVASDPQKLVDMFRSYDPDPQLESAVKARLAEIDGAWLLDELGRLRRPLTTEQMVSAREAFADMESAAIVRELLAEWYFFHPDVLPLADARLAQLEHSRDS